VKLMFLSQSPFSGSRERHDRVQGLLRSYSSPGTNLDLCYPDDFPGARVFQRMGEQTILTGLHHALETPHLVRKIVWAEQHGYEAVVQSNTFDPGVEAARLAVRIPVVGVFRTALHVAATLAARIAVMVPLDGHVPYTWRIINSYGMDRSVVSVRPIQVYGTDLAHRREEIKSLAVSVMRRQVNDDGAEIIIPLGGALIPYVVSPDELAEQIGVPVLNTKAIGIRFAETCVGLGLAQSEAAYPHAELTLDDFDDFAYAP
jgi:allantoin racemase